MQVLSWSQREGLRTKGIILFLLAAEEAKTLKSTVANSYSPRSVCAILLQVGEGKVAHAMLPTTAQRPPAATLAFQSPIQQQQRGTQRRPFGVAPRGGRALRRAALQRCGAAEQQQQQPASEAAVEAAGPTRTLQQLKEELAAAVKQEDYAAAAVLRDALRQAEHADPLLRLRGELERAVRGEEYEVKACLWRRACRVWAV